MRTKYRNSDLGASVLEAHFACHIGRKAVGIHNHLMAFMTRNSMLEGCTSCTIAGSQRPSTGGGHSDRGTPHAIESLSTLAVGIDKSNSSGNGGKIDTGSRDVTSTSSPTSNSKTWKIFGEWNRFCLIVKWKLAKIENKWCLEDIYLVVF